MWLTMLVFILRGGMATRYPKKHLLFSGCSLYALFDTLFDTMAQQLLTTLPREILWTSRKNSCCTLGRLQEQTTLHDTRSWTLYCQQQK
jgi:hypothetical protein